MHSILWGILTNGRQYYLINNAIKIHNGNSSSKTSMSRIVLCIDIGIDAFYKKYWHPYFKIIKVCNSYDECGYKSERPWRYVSNEPATILFSHRDYRVPFLTSDGFLYSFSIASGNVDSQDSSVFVDINGPKGPNIMGIDFFVFEPTDRNIFMPKGYDLSENDCNSSDNGSECAAKIIQDNWEIKDDYPWR